LAAVKKTKKQGKPPLAKAGLAFAVQAMRTGQGALAESTCRSLLVMNRKDADALLLLGTLLGRRGASAEAAEVLEEAVAAAPRSTRILVGTGVQLMESAPERAETLLRQAIEIAPRTVAARGYLATLLDKSGRFEEADEQLRRLLADAPEDISALYLHGSVLRSRKAYHDEVPVLQKLTKLVPQDATLRPILERAFFLWAKSVQSSPEEELQVVEAWLRFDPFEVRAVQRRAELTGQPVPERASPEYLRAHFDEFAPSFDDALTGLGYRGPELVVELLRELAPAATGALDVVDVGCGTGRIAPLIAPWKRRLVGLDLAPKMLTIARSRGIYDDLHEVDVVEFLEQHGAEYDIATCVDTLIYFGSIDAPLRAAFNALRPGGFILGTTEVLEDGRGNFHLHDGARYSHSKGYLRHALEQAGFRLHTAKDVTLRTEGEVPVRGEVFGAQRPG